MQNLRHERLEDESIDDLVRASMLPKVSRMRIQVDAAQRSGDFYKCLSLDAVNEFESLGRSHWCEDNRTLLCEGAPPITALFLLEGRAKLSMNSVEGKRRILGVAVAGDFLGLAAVVSGFPYEITAASQYPCEILSLPRQVFLEFLVHYPAASQSVSRQLSLDYRRACEQLRNLGLAFSASTKLARLLLEWCADGRKTERGIRIQCSLTHEEIGEFIGVARETVTRTLTEFRHRELVEQCGSTLFISDLRALEIYAGQSDC